MSTTTQDMPMAIRRRWIVCILLSGSVWTPFVGELTAQERRQTNAIQLDEITVRGDRLRTEGSGSIIAEGSTVGGRLDLSLKETPRSVTVLTRQRLEDENITSLSQAAEKATGVYVRNEGDLSDGPFFYSRGFLMAVSENGVPFDTTYYGPGIDMAIYDRVEILRGPDGLIQGQGEPGGTINLVRKRPSATPQFQTDLALGQWDYARGMLDVSAPLVESGAIRGRLVGLASTRKSHLPFVGQEQFLGYGTIEADITDQTVLRLSALVQNDTVNPHFGALHIPGTDGWTPRDLYLGAHWSRFEYRRREASIDLEHSFSDNWSFAMSTTYRNYDDFKRFAYHNPYPYLDVTGTSPLINRASWFEGDQWTGDAHVKGRFDAFGRSHEVVLGGNFEYFDQERWIRNASSVGLWPIGNPNVPQQDLEKAASTPSVISQTGIYAQGRFGLTHNLHLHLGGRLSNYKYESGAGDARRPRYDETGVFTPYGGLVWDLTPDWTAYVSYSDIFRPQMVGTEDASGRMLPPVVGRQYEAGLKASLWDGRLNPSIAVFHAEDTNRAINLGGGEYVASGEVRSRGFEVEIGARPLDNLELVAGYTFTDSYYSAGYADAIGQRFSTFAPRHSFKLWSNYTLRNGSLLDGLELGVGVKAFSESSTTFAQPYAAHVVQPAYAVVDARIGYEINENASLSLDVSNLLDKTYTAYPSMRAFYGEPRRVTLKAQMKW